MAQFVSVPALKFPNIARFRQKPVIDQLAKFAGLHIEKLGGAALADKERDWAGHQEFHRVANLRSLERRSVNLRRFQVELRWVIEYQHAFGAFP